MGEFNVPNRTIFCGDNLPFMQGINNTSVDCIYLDPPYYIEKGDYSGSSVAKEWSEPTKAQTASQMKNLSSHTRLAAWLQSWGAGSEERRRHAYLVFMATRLLECHRILKPSGSLFVHSDDRMSHSLKLVLDCIFNITSYRFEMICPRTLHHQGKNKTYRGFERETDRILWYAKTSGKHPKGPDKDLWPRQKLKEDDAKQVYATQKPLALVKYLIKSATKKNGVVLDVFAGSATAAEAAELLGRRWVMADTSNETSRLARKRPGLKSVDIITTKHLPAIEEEQMKKDIEGFVYVIEDTDRPGWFKVGMTQNHVAGRLIALQVGRSNPDSLKLVYAVKTKEFKRIERCILSSFPRKREWVQVASIKEIKDAIRLCMIKPPRFRASKRKVRKKPAAKKASQS